MLTLREEIAKERFLDICAVTDSKDIKQIAVLAVAQADALVAALEIKKAVEKFNSYEPIKTKGCRSCHGSGGKREQPCRDCKGSGKVLVI